MAHGGRGKRQGRGRSRARKPVRSARVHSMTAPDGAAYTELELELSLDEPDTDAHLRTRVAKALERDPEGLGTVRIERRAIDARRGRVRFQLKVSLDAPERDLLSRGPLRDCDGPPQAVVVGAGPGGTFCAWALARQGIASVVLDRGKMVQPRRKDLKLVNQRGIVDPESNYCFGEGGAGTYSDGKLYTRSDKRGDVRDVLEILTHCGAPEDILVDARPHIGSNRLPKVVTTMREELESVGVEFRFEAKVTGLLREGDEVRGVRLASGEEIRAEHVVLATGHSARDVHDLLDEAGVALEAKPFALGVRIEHPQALINEIQYGVHADNPRLPAAPYKVAYTAPDGHGVFSFCMCPGGFIVPATTEGDAVVVNGMSPAKRNSHFANSGLVVAVTVEDVRAAGFEGPCGGVELQRAVEREAFKQGGGAFRAPATRVTDFLARRASTSVPTTSYQPGLLPTDIGPVLDVVGLPFADRLRDALGRFDLKMRGYVSEESVLVATESRTSSPVRVPRDHRSLESPDLRGLYPCAEGAGYAGGIVSAAIDGMRIAAVITERVRPV